ncbi:cob(I)yrinic acid a,c-diamide adenosyltransferase [Desulfosporosinus meridiei]|uniref:Cob(I)alamin adenosyltransferase n=1 Tax=Desulfosporosinus meridiei (strain ATCC BAA-275 / DSM 13257 / KCTC 12902 / NCIMB 13706 / S10) TaxID=768704 RepID=J7ILQ1_DESMD|nr:cob(I)yrinic acid a,c-diamide adenosyltransferase [Desulfosporosinus meridiei]AFQ42490.1 cob(I)alamin adenosyltransferase [Desulfosporosinus meridiei DSM 13257]
MEQGLIHIYTGAGKGKTTAAIGLGIRAYGQGLKVNMVQFLKGWDTGEMKVIAALEPHFQIFRYKENDKFVWEMSDEETGSLKREMRVCLNYAIEAIMSEEWDMVILDEIMAAVNYRFLPLAEVVEAVKNKPKKLELILTGRDAPVKLIELADYVSEITSLKHPMEKGIMARVGIEY